MVVTKQVFDGRRLLILLSVLLALGFFATTLGSYFVSKHAIREAIIGQELPLASSNIYVELQKDLVQPVVISSTMAHDTFLRDWALRGERNVDEMNRYLQEIKTRYGAFSSFFVSDRSFNYYTGNGILKRISATEPRDAWYFRVRGLKEDHEINVDPDLANQDAMTIFINYRVFDFSGQYLGATGIGLTMDAMHRRIKDYQQRYRRTIYFVDGQGKAVLFGGNGAPASPDLHARPGLRDIIDRILLEKNGGYQYEAHGTTHLLNVHYVPELKWYLFVEKDESEALAEVREVLYINLAICLVVTLLVVLLMNLSLSRYQRRIETMAATDKLTGMLNRQAFTILMSRMLAAYQRQPHPISILLFDLDNFKQINDRHGHALGDSVLCRVAEQLQQGLRKSDIAVRWGGEEFLAVLDNCDSQEACQTAEKIRQRIAQEKFEIDGVQLALTVSVGVSQFSGDEAVEQTISRADAGLYQAKSSGRNRVCVAAAAPSSA
ncbi:MAG: sensor domain-containing diguanylate cyclase [Rhodoferax sp.]|uniref:sensor domain-containing diguanylate cyclase n=1 Tax=Rhodoferax sp. TaxID=50421 RepID=UPI00260761CD|nr:sensor domain-containing diguanylate cyclase [Rhodoferax sp.]MDD5333855.1 sensor domain-containing diguanylate cyclase [Rhodoferax sp.]